MSEQSQYEAGQQAWQDCLPIVLARVPDSNIEEATPFMAGFIEVMLMVLLANSGEEGMVHTMHMAMANAIEQHKIQPLNPAEWRQQ